MMEGGREGAETERGEESKKRVRGGEEGRERAKVAVEGAAACACLALMSAAAL